MNTSYTDSIQTVNSAEYEDMFNNLSKFVSDNDSSPHIFNAILDIMQREHTLSSMWGLEKLCSTRDLLLAKKASH